MSSNSNNDVQFVTSSSNLAKGFRKNAGKDENRTLSRKEHLSKREELCQITKSQFIPKAFALACSLVPQVKQEYRKKQQRHLQEENDTLILKSTGLDEDLEDGLCCEELKTVSPRSCAIDYENECCHLPPSAAKALTSLLRSSRTQRYQLDHDISNINYASDRDDDDEDSILLGSKELFGLKSDLDLRDKEGDALLDSIRNETLTPPSISVPFWANNDHDTISTDSNPGDSSNQAEKEDDDISLTTIDDDDLHGELNRLGNVISSLRNDLDLVETNHRHPGENRPAERRRSFISPASVGLDDGLKTWPSLGRALSSHNRAQGQDGGRIIDCASSLYFAVAFVWAVVILLTGHVKFSGEMETLSDFLDFIMNR